MGLDMYIKKLTRVSMEEAAKTHTDDLKCSYFFEEDILADKDAYEGIMPILTKSEVLCPVWNIPAIRKVYNVPKGARYRGVVMWSGDESVHAFRKGDERITVEIPRSEQDVCIKDEKACVYLANIETVGYWRKNYPLRDNIYDAFAEDGITVENCGYYPLTGAVIDVITTHATPSYDARNVWSSGYSQLKPESDDEIIVYHEWY